MGVVSYISAYARASLESRPRDLIANRGAKRHSLICGVNEPHLIYVRTQANLGLRPSLHDLEMLVGLVISLQRPTPKREKWSR